VVEVGAPRAGDAQALAANLRDQDREECRAAGVGSVEAAVEDGIARSTLCWTARLDGELVCVFGVAPGGTVLAPVGIVWMLGTPLVARHRRTLQRLTPGYIQQMLGAFPHLVNRVHARNTLAVRWLKRMGFVLHPAEAVPPYGEPFHLFEMKR
jgi:stage V sporulation protein SpoVS